MFAPHRADVKNVRMEEHVILQVQGLIVLVRPVILVTTAKRPKLPVLMFCATMDYAYVMMTRILLSATVIQDTREYFAMRQTCASTTHAKTVGLARKLQKMTSSFAVVLQSFLARFVRND